MKKTGVFASEKEAEQIKNAAAAPYIIVDGMAPETAQQVAHKIALKHGLPEVSGYYGIDLRTREFLVAD